MKFHNVIVTCPVNLLGFEAGLVRDGIEIILVNRKGRRRPDLTAVKVPQLQRLLARNVWSRQLMSV